MTLLDEIYRRQFELMRVAEDAGIVIKVNMPSTREVNAYKTKAGFTVAVDGPGRTLVYPTPSATGQHFKA